MAALAHAAHLVSRFAETVAARPPAPDDELWVAGELTSPEWGVWSRLDDVDRRHLIRVARRIEHSPTALEHPWMIRAALLHDIGKGDTRLGVIGRVTATLIGVVAGNRLRKRPGLIEAAGRIGRYLNYPERGALILQELDSGEPVVAWAREHHLNPGEWTVAHDAGLALYAADQ